MPFCTCCAPNALRPNRVLPALLRASGKGASFSVRFDNTFGADGFQDISIQAGRYNTHSAAYVVLALDAYANQVDNKVAGKLSITEIAADGKEQVIPLPENLIPRVSFAASAKKLRFANEAALTTFYAMAESGFDKVPPTTELSTGFQAAPKAP